MNRPTVAIALIITSCAGYAVGTLHTMNRYQRLVAAADSRDDRTNEAMTHLIVADAELKRANFDLMKQATALEAAMVGCK